MLPPSTHDLARDFLHELAEQGEHLCGLKGTETFLLKSKEGVSRVHFWKVDVMVFRFLSAHACAGVRLSVRGR